MVLNIPIIKEDAASLIVLEVREILDGALFVAAELTALSLINEIVPDPALLTSADAAAFT